jgi:hypothetical protein
MIASSLPQQLPVMPEIGRISSETGGVRCQSAQAFSWKISPKSAAREFSLISDGFQRHTARRLKRFHLTSIHECMHAHGVHAARSTTAHGRVLGLFDHHHRPGLPCR